MAKGRPRKQTKKEEAPQQIAKKVNIATPELVGNSFASLDFPERLQQPGYTTHFFSALRGRFNNLYDGIMPFQEQQGFISVREAIWLCQKAYHNVAIFRNSINTLTELANTDVYLEGGNDQSQAFFDAWFKKIHLWKLKDMGLRELFRGGNLFLFRVDGNVTKSDALKLSQTYAATTGVQLPLRYIVLNVADIATINSLTFDNPQYFKVLTPQQLKQLSSSADPDDKEVFKNLKTSIKEYFGTPTGRYVPLDLTKLHTLFYQKQDYEPFAVPMGFAVLDDINLKLEFKKTDAVLARTVEYVMLHLKQGSEEKPDGTGGTSEQAMKALQELFKKEQVGRVLVTDWSTTADWVIPDLNKIFGPQKYQVVNEDIAQGLVDVFFGQQRFANVAAKLKVFVEKLNNVQDLFINEFLLPEVRRVAELMNFKSYPIPRFVRINLDDSAQMMRVYTQLVQLGVLTAKDALETISTGEFPDFDKLVRNQTEYKSLKDKGLFQPVILAYPPEQVAAAQAKYPKPAPGSAPSGGGKPSSPAGRPPGAKAPQTTKKIGPIGTGSEKEYSMSKLMETIRLSDKIRDKVLVAYKKKHNKKRINENDKSLIEQVSVAIFENEESKDWEDKVEDYIKNPIVPNIERISDIEDIMTTLDLSRNAAALLYNSKI